MLALVKLLYLDEHATTQPSPRVVAAVTTAMRCCGNASSSHHPGRAMGAMVERAREQVARAAGVEPSLVVFTSGATEANNLAIRGAVEACDRDGNGRRRIVTTATEHSSILSTCRALEAQGRAELTVVPVDGDGAVDLVALEQALGPDVAIVSVMHANNEIGTVNDIAAVARICDRFGAPLHVDCCQTFAKIPLDPGLADYVSASAHKLRGPTGVGAIVCGSEDARRWLVPQQTGGTQEDGERAGTTNTHGIVGFGEAAEETRAAWAAGEGQHLAALRTMLFTMLRDGLGSEWVRLNGPGEARRRLPQNLNVTFIGVCPISLDEAVRDRVAVSGAAACRALGGERSHVLEAIGSPDDGATVRFGLGQITQAEVMQVARLFCDTARRLRGSACPIPGARS